MEVVLQYEIPVLHPVAVHFAVALLPVAAFCAVVWMFGGARFWRRATLLLSVFSLAGVAFAYGTGDRMAELSEGVPIVEELVARHALMAQYTFIASAIVVAGLALVVFWLERRTTIERNPPDPFAVRLAFGLLVVGLAVLASWTGHIGGVMTWGVAP